MRASILVLAVMIGIVMASAASGQRLSDDNRDSLSTPRSSGQSGVPEPSRPRVREFTPESHVPYRSPDLGSAYFPLSPAIGPGSSGLGPAAGPDASRRRPAEWDAERERKDRLSRQSSGRVSTTQASQCDLSAEHADARPKASNGQGTDTRRASYRV